MAFLTWILVGIAALLVIVIFILDSIKIKRAPPYPMHATLARAEEEPYEIQRGQERSFPNEQFTARLDAAEQKIAMAHDRLQRIEQILSKLPLTQLEKAFDLSDLEKRIIQIQKIQAQMQQRLETVEQNLADIKMPIRNIEPLTVQQLRDLEQELAKQDQSLQELEIQVKAAKQNAQR